MSDATHTPRALLAERFGHDIVPLDLDDQSADDGGRRARFVALLHSLIAWFIAHPEIPVPHGISFHATAADMADLERVAKQLGRHIYGDHPQIDYDLARDPDSYASILVAMPRPDRPL